MPKIKILQFPIANTFGGITHYALNNWKWMDKSCFECDFATMSKSLDFADEILKTGSNIYYISCYAEQNREQFIKEFKAILDNGYDVVHLHTKQWKSFLVEELCRERGVKKVIVHSHSTKCDNNDEQKRIAETERHYKVLSQFNETLATDFWACSQEAADWLFGDRIPSSKKRIMNNAIETERFLYNETVRNRLRKECNLEGKFVIGNVGRLCHPKNQAFLIEAFALACKSRRDLVLVIIGDGELRSTLEQTAQNCGVRDNILFLGKRTDVDNLYQMMDLFVLPSRYEGSPIVAIEAQASGLEVFLSEEITKEVAVTENIEYLPLEKELWARKMSSIQVYERKNMKNAIIKTGFDLFNQVKILEQLYKDGL